MTGQHPDDPLAEPPSVEDALFDEAVAMEDLDDPDDVGDVDVEVGEVIDVVDGVEIRNEVDERDLVLPVEDAAGALIGGDTFPEIPDLVT
jgi:hypothetical protein